MSQTPPPDPTPMLPPPAGAASVVPSPSAVSAAPALPAQAVPAAPALPAQAMPAAPALPAQAVPAAPALPVPSLPVSVMPAVGATTAAGGPMPPSPDPEAVPAGYEAFDPAGATDEDGLLPARVARIVWIVAQVLAVPLGFVGVGLIAGALVYLAVLPTWSALVGVNVRRAKPATQYQQAPSPIWLSLSWLTPLAVLGAVVFGAIVLGSLDDASNRTLAADELTFGDLSLAVVIGGALAVLVSLYVPYSAHARAARWVGGDGGSFIRWFWSPIVAALVGAVVLRFVGRMLVSSGTEVSPAAAFVLFAVLTVPGLVYLLVGNRAMSGLEQATEAAAARRRLGATPVDGLTPAQITALQGPGRAS